MLSRLGACSRRPHHGTRATAQMGSLNRSGREAEDHKQILISPVIHEA